MTSPERARKPITPGECHIVRNARGSNHAISDPRSGMPAAIWFHVYFSAEIYFPQMNKRAWLKLIFQNRRRSSA